MKRISFMVISCVTLALMTSALPAFGQGGTDTLQAVPGFAPVLSLTESSTDSVKTVPGQPPTYEKVTAEKSTISITANITGVNLASIGPGTSFDISVGGLSVSGTLGEDPTFTEANKATKRSIFIPAKTNPDNGKAIGTTGIRLSWTATRLTVSISRATGDDVDPGNVAAKGFVGGAEPGKSVTIRATVPVSVAFAGLTSEPRPAFIQGTTSQRIQKYGSEAAGNEVEHTLDTVSLTGAFDTALPTVSITAPANNSNQTGSFILRGKAADGHGVDAVEFTNNLESPLPWSPVLDPLTDLPPLLPEGAAWGTTNKEWTLPVNPLPFGTTKFWVRSVDSSGNRSTPAVFAFVNPMPPLLTGRWDGLAVPLEGKRGYLTFTCDMKGALLSGKLTLEGTAAPISFVGAWSGETIRATIKRTIGTPLLLTGTVNSTSPTSAAAATLSFDLVELPAVTGGPNVPFGEGTAFRCPYSATNKLPNKAPTISPAIGRFNVAVAPGNATSIPPSPSGCSYFSMVVTDTGVVSVAGRTADGATLAMSSVLGADGQVPIFVPLYTNKGCFTVLEKIDMLNGAVLSPEDCIWRRPQNHTDKQFPAGFDLALPTEGMRYTAPPANTRVMSLIAASPNASAEWQGDAVTVPQTQVLEVSKTNAVIPVGGGAAFKGTIATATGIVSGSFNLPGTTTAAPWFALIVGNAAEGHYIAPPITKTVPNRYGKISLSGDVPTFDGGDDFNDNVRDLNKWRSTDIAYGGGVLTETNGRLELTIKSAVAETQVLRPWTRNFGSLAEEFEVIVDVHNSITPPPSTNTPVVQPNASMGITLFNSADPTDNIYLELYRGSDGYYFLTSLVVDDNGDLSNDADAEQSSPDGSLRLHYDPATRVVTAYYDANGATGGYSWTQLASYGIGGSGGTTSNAAWSLTGNPALGITISTFAEKMPVTSGQVYVDNFQVNSISD